MAASFAGRWEDALARTDIFAGGEHFRQRFEMFWQRVEQLPSEDFAMARYGARYTAERQYASAFCLSSTAIYREKTDNKHHI